MTSGKLLLNLEDETIKLQQEETQTDEVNFNQIANHTNSFNDKISVISLPTTSSDTIDPHSLPEVNFINLKLDTTDGECLPLLDRQDVHYNQFPGKKNYVI